MRIAQEAMSNVRMHADATTVAVALDEHDGVLELSVQDDGAGFYPVAAAHSGRFGLTTMAERARAVAVPRHPLDARRERPSPYRYRLVRR